MAQQYGDMYSEYNPSNRSPGSQRGYAPNGTLNRQPSRHFDNYGGNQLQGLYTAEDHAASQYDPPSHRFDRMPSATLHSNYQYENQTWNYGGANGNSNMMGGTGRVKPSSRRAGLPPVSSRTRAIYQALQTYTDDLLRIGWTKHPLCLNHQI